MPYVLIGAATLLVGGLGAYAIHTGSSGINQATSTVGTGIGTGAALAGAGVAAAAIIFVIYNHK